MAAFAAFAFALAATGAGAADISFVEGRLDAKEVKGSGECSRMTLESFDARGDVISGSWIHPYALGNIDIAIKGNAIDADFSGMWIDSATATTERVGRDLHVMFDVSVEGEGPCEVAFVLPGVIADAPTTVAVSPSPSPTLSQTSEAQQVAPLLPQASPIQLAAAPGNKFDGEWEGDHDWRRRLYRGEFSSRGDGKRQCIFDSYYSSKIITGTYKEKNGRFGWGKRRIIVLEWKNKNPW